MKSKIKSSILALAFSGIMVCGAVSAKDFNFEDASNVSIGMTMSEVELVLGSDKVDARIKEETHWIYTDTEERFGPDLEKEVTVVFNAAGKVDNVFENEGGFGLWALTSLVLVGLLFL